jgi:dUTP pyrophosphatase
MLFMEHVDVKIVRTNPEKTDLPLPCYATEGSAGMDVCADIKEEMTLAPGETILIPAGFSMELPQGFEAQIRPRSGLAIKHHIGILNAPGTIDSDYRGEVKIILTNFGKSTFVVRRGDRIAQMVVAPYSRVTWSETDTLNESQRGAGGFGHSGVAAKGV